jgi:hypothetical protein
MTTLLQVASRVEAAVQAYISVQALQGFAGGQEWKENFMRELVSAHIRGVLIRSLYISNRHFLHRNFGKSGARTRALALPCTPL